MADEAEDEVLELGDDQEIGEQDQDQDQDDQTDEQDAGEPDEGEEETVISFGDEDEAAPASGDGDTPLIKHLRETARRLAKENAELRKGGVQSQQAIDPGPEPTLEGCDYDEDKFRNETKAWLRRCDEAEKQKSEGVRQQEQAEEAWQQRLQAYDGARKQLPFADAETAGDTVEAVIGLDRRKALIRVADKPAELEYALSKNPQRLEAISKISDPVELIKAFVRMEGDLRVSTKKKAPAPEKIARGNASVSAKAADKELERLEKQAERTGDRTALIAYKRKLAAQAK